MTQKTLSVPGSELNENEQILDIETTGRYWRTSRLTSVALIAPGSSAGTFTETVLAASNDEEEYRLLNDLPSRTSTRSTRHTDWSILLPAQESRISFSLFLRSALCSGCPRGVFAIWPLLLNLSAERTPSKPSAS